jgi:hypothetical protein
MRLRDFDRRWIFLAIGLVAVLFLRIPLGLSFRPSEQTKGFFEAVESVERGSTVFLAVDYGPSSQAEILPMHEAVVERFLRRDVRIVSASVWETGPPLTENVFTLAASRLEKEGIQKQYGVDFVNLGFKAGTDVALAKIGSSIREAFPLDYRGTPVEEIPIMKGVENFDQISLLCEMSAGDPGARQWLQQVQKRYEVRMIAGVTAVMAPDLYSFYQSKQIEGFLGGLVGAAEYEYLLERPGAGMGGMNVQSIAHFLILGFVLLGNVIYVLERRRGRRGEA